MNELLTQARAQEEAVALLSFVYQNKYIKPTNKNNRDYFTDNLLKARFDVYSYFDPNSDNDDVLYNILHEETSEQFTRDQRDQIMFYVQLIREDYYMGKAQPITLTEQEVYMTNLNNSSVNNLTPMFLQYSEEHRKIFYALLKGDYYIDFVR